MRPRLFVWAGFILIAALGGVLTYTQSRGQTPGDSPKKLPPSIVVPSAPKGDVVPAALSARKPAPIDRFRDEASLDELTRQLYFSARRGMEWLSRDGIHLPNGRFVPGVNAALGKQSDDESYFRQAAGAFALSRAAKFTGDEKYAVRAAESILSLLAEAPKDATGIRKPSQPSAVSNRVGSAALLAMAIFELPDAGKELVQCAEELCAFLKVNIKADGAVQAVEPGELADGDEAQQSIGLALTAIAVSNRIAPAAWKSESLSRASAHYRKQFVAAPNAMIVPWLTAAFAEAHLQTKETAYADFVFEMADWLKKLQYETADTRRANWRGGFPTVVDGKQVQSAPTIDAALYALGFADACRMIRGMDRPDLARYEAYRLTLTRTLQFVATLQYAGESTQHFTTDFRGFLVGGFHPSATDGNLRTDHTAFAVAALGQYLIIGADR